MLKWTLNLLIIAASVVSLGYLNNRYHVVNYNKLTGQSCKAKIPVAVPEVK